MKKVLLAEDNEDMVELIKLVLGESGYELVVAADGEEAVRLSHELNPDLILMDIRIPKKDGFTATRELRSGGFEKPIVILTGSEKQEDRDQAAEAGCNDYILKTMDMKEVKDVLDRYLAEAGGGLE
ncbi:MAG: response regulator [Gammaproteobacteria bacterium]